jgi:hypothetical protein
VDERVLPVEASFEITMTDLLRANLWWLFRKWFMAFLLVVNVLLVIYMVPVMAARGFELADLRGFIIPVMVIVVLPASVCWGAYSSIRNLQPKQLQHHYRFAPDTIQIDTGLSTATVAWEAVQRVVEKRPAFYLFMHKTIFHVVPKRGLAGRPELDRLRQMFQGRLGSKAKLRADGAGLGV